MSFGLLTLVVLAGLAGPLLAALPRVGLPLVVGEVIAGVALGRAERGGSTRGNRRSPSSPRSASRC